LIKRLLTTTSLLSSLLLATGCGVIPKDGPSGDEVRSGAEVQLTDPSYLSYALVKITPTVARHVQREMAKPVLFRADSRSTGLPTARVGAGDTVTVTIFEAQAGGLFIPGQPGTSAGNFVTIPAQQVDRSGQITVPYAGAIAAVGRTPAEIQADIENKLRSRAIEPQVVVNISNRQADEISILGEVNAPARFSLEPGGTKLLNAIARAGGTRNPGYETVITLQRRGRVDQALLTSIIANPSYNINLVPGDVVYASREQRFYMVFGATPAPGGVVGSQNRRFTFEVENLTKKLLTEMGVDVSRFQEENVPTVYTLDLSGTQGFFIANSFYMRHKDVIFVSDSPSRDLIKFLDIIRAIGNTVTDVTAARNGVVHLD
jgi:polysaccharide export outer membrane protein